MIIFASSIFQNLYHWVDDAWLSHHQKICYLLFAFHIWNGDVQAFCTTIHFSLQLKFNIHSTHISQIRPDLFSSCLYIERETFSYEDREKII